MDVMGGPQREPLRYSKAERLMLRDVGHDERWLQDRIEDDPSVLGLGELTIRHRERKQSSGGRIDFLMEDSDSNTLYEVEVMLGRLNESHIIRTIEYWDIERRRWPNREHVAVVVAEEITNRFFNVIALLNRSVPIIALQLDALTIGNNLVLHFTKVLDMYETAEDEELPADDADRAYWEQRSTPESLKIFDELMRGLKTRDPDIRITYNKAHIAVGSSRRNFSWFELRRKHCSVQARVGEEQVDTPVVRKLEDTGLSVNPRRTEIVRFSVTERDLEDSGSAILDVLFHALDVSQE